MGPNLIRAEIEACHSSSRLGLAKSLSVGMKDFSRCVEALRLFSTAHLTMLMEAEEPVVKFHQMLLCSLMSN